MLQDKEQLLNFRPTELEYSLWPHQKFRDRDCDFDRDHYFDRASDRDFDCDHVRDTLATATDF